MKDKAIEYLRTVCRECDILGTQDQIHPHNWLRAIVEATGDSMWMLNYRNELVYMRDFNKRSFSNKYIIIEDTDHFYERFCKEAKI